MRTPIRKMLSVVLAVILLATVVSVPVNAADTVIHTNVTTNTSTEYPVNLLDSVTVIPPVVSVEQRDNGVTIETIIEKTITVSNREKKTVEKITTRTITIVDSSCPEGAKPQQQNSVIWQKANNKLESIKAYAAARGWNTIIQSTKNTHNKVVMNLRFTGRSGYLDIVQTTTHKNGKYKTCYKWAEQDISLENLKDSLELYR